MWNNLFVEYQLREKTTFGLDLYRGKDVSLNNTSAFIQRKLRALNNWNWTKKDIEKKNQLKAG